LDVVFSLIGGSESLVVVIAVDSGAFKPIRAIELLKFLYVGFRKRLRTHILQY